MGRSSSSSNCSSSSSNSSSSSSSTVVVVVVVVFVSCLCYFLPVTLHFIFYKHPYLLTGTYLLTYLLTTTTTTAAVVAYDNHTLLIRLMARCARSECAASFWSKISMKLLHIFDPSVTTATTFNNRNLRQNKIRWSQLRKKHAKKLKLRPIFEFFLQTIIAAVVIVGTF